MESKPPEIDEFAVIREKQNVISMKTIGSKKKIRSTSGRQKKILQNEPKPAKITGMAKEKIRLESIIKNLQAENQKLSRQVKIFEGKKPTPEEKDQIFEEFEKELNLQVEKLENRKKKLNELNNLVSSFRCLEQEQFLHHLTLNKSDNYSRESKQAKQNNTNANPEEEEIVDPLSMIPLDSSDDEEINKMTKLKNRPSTSLFRLKHTSVKYPQLEKYTVTSPPQALLITPINKTSSTSPSTTRSFTATTMTTSAINAKNQKTLSIQSIQKQRLIPSSKVLKKFKEMVETESAKQENSKMNRVRPPYLPNINEIQPIDMNSNKKPTFSPLINADRQEIVEEHSRLVSISLNLERAMLVKKMMLRLYHDHRDLCSLRVLLNSIEGGGTSNMDEKKLAEDYRIKIANLRDHIQREKIRLTAVMKKPDKLETAALSIQSLIRGYLCRKKLKEKANNQT